MSEAAYSILGSSHDRKSWLATRRAGIGSSDAAAVLGCSRFSSRLSVFADKVLEPEEETEEPEWVTWGRKLEPVIIEAFAEETGRVVERNDALIGNRERPFMLATLDAIQWRDDRDDPGFLEVKNSRFSMPSVGVPRDYWVQCQHQAAVSGYGWGSFAVLVMGSQFLWCDVDVDREFIETTLIPEEEAFWRIVENGGPQPAADASPATKAALSRLFPNETGETKPLPGELIELDDERANLAAHIRDLEQRKTEIENRFRQAIGEAAEGILPNGRRWTYKANKRGVRTLRAPQVEKDEETAA